MTSTARWSPEDYARNAAFVPAMGAPVVELLAPRAGERILDLGCGDGVLSAALVKAGAIVIGIDGSPEMVAAARAAGIDAQVGDGEALAFGPAFDAVFTNAALHWMRDAAAVARGVFAALKPGGRFVGEMGGAGNVAPIWQALAAELAVRGLSLPQAHVHWYPTVPAFTEVYAAAGFADIDAMLIPRPTPLTTGIAGWVRTFFPALLADIGLTTDAVADAIERRLDPELRAPEAGPEAGRDAEFVAPYVRLRFSMRKPA